MRHVPRLYVDVPLFDGHFMSLAPHHVHHIIHVLRLSEGGHVRLFNGVDGEWDGLLTSVGKRQWGVTVKNQRYPQPLPRPFRLIFSPLKPQAMDILLEKGTEIGITDFVPAFMDHTSVSKINLPKMQARVVAAAEQAGHCHIPQIHREKKLYIMIDECTKTEYVYWGVEKFSLSKQNDLSKDKKYSRSLLIGPEGGFSTKEFDWLFGHPNVLPLGIDGPVFRAETAAICLSFFIMYHKEILI